MTLRCPKDGFPMAVDTDWIGRTVYACEGCRRTAKGLCLDCARLLDRKGKRCVACHEKRRQLTNHLGHRRRQMAEGRPVHPNPGHCVGCGAAVKIGNTKWCPTCDKARDREYDRARYAWEREKRSADGKARYQRDPESKCAASRARYRRDIAKIKRRRFGKPKGPDRKEYFRAYNARRREEKREQMKALAVAKRPDPVCMACGVTFPRGLGRPSRWCPEHRGVNGAVLRRAA